MSIAPSLERELLVQGDALGRIRVQALAGLLTRVAFDLGGGKVDWHSFAATDPYRVILDFQAPGGGTRGPRIVVLDPGHGGRDKGAASPSGRLREAKLVLDLAMRVRRTLHRRMPGVRVVLTRERDRSLGLEERVAIANAWRADVFVSLHLNSSSAHLDGGGVATFVLSGSREARARALAAREHVGARAELSGMQRLVESLQWRRLASQSRRLAERVHRSSLLRARQALPNLKDRKVRRGLFFVLVGARMPAILHEASFLTVQQEADALATERYRELLAGGIAEGIQGYLSSSSPPPG